MDYLYDGTFDGFLNCVYHHYYTEKAEGIFEEKDYQYDFTRPYMVVETEEMKADRVYEAIEKRFSAYEVRRIYRAFLTSMDRKEMRVLNYLRLGFSHKNQDISRLHGHPIVNDFELADQKVTREIDKFLGVLRFEYLKGNVAYARMEPECDMLELIADHFADRFCNEAFIIHDVRRKKAVISRRGQWYMTFFDETMLPDLSEEEKDYQRLWKEYFQNIAIKERVNPRCQRTMLPKKYWKNMTEMKLL